MTTPLGVLGLGAIGSVLASQLLRQGVSPVAFTRRLMPEIQVSRPGGTTRLRLPQYQLLDEDIPRPDWLFVCLKAYHFAGAEDWWPRILRPATKVVVVRNGLDLAAPLAVYHPRERILPLLIDCPTEKLGNSQYKQLGPVRFLGPADHPLRDAFTTDLAGVAKASEWAADFHTYSWAKLCESAALGALTVYYRDTCRIFADPDIRQAYAELLAENISIARADGAQLPNSFHYQLMQKLDTYPPTKGSSMLTDLRLGRPLELAAKGGAIIERAQALAIPAPLNKSIIHSAQPK